MSPAFPAQHGEMLEQLFSPDNDWQHQKEAFYRCALSDVTGKVPLEFSRELIDRMRAITGLPLVDRVLVTAQEMLAGQAIGVHSDQPYLGYEIARLIVQLNKDWQPAHGGVLGLYASDKADDAGSPEVSFNPVYNSALAFVLHPDSFHAVTEVTHPRRTVVFNFWHAANTPELASHLKALFDGLSFSEFPAALDGIASAAEKRLPEDITFRAGTAAIALGRWGYDDDTIVSGYRFSAGLDEGEPNDPETRAAVLLADWVALLYRERFDLARWELLRMQLAGCERFPRLKSSWELAAGLHCRA